jgi:hypothetical protein
MPDLSKRESFYIFVSTLAALSVLITILAFWAERQPKCWDLHNTEQTAIQACEQ